MLNILEPPFGLRGAHAKYLLAHNSALTAKQAGDIDRFYTACTCYHKDELVRLKYKYKCLENKGSIQSQFGGW